MPGDMVFLFESVPGWNQVGTIALLRTDRHEIRGSYILFVDGTIEFVKSDDIEQLNWGENRDGR